MFPLYPQHPPPSSLIFFPFLPLSFSLSTKPYPSTSSSIFYFIFLVASADDTNVSQWWIVVVFAVLLYFLLVISSKGSQHIRQGERESSQVRTEEYVMSSLILSVDGIFILYCSENKMPWRFKYKHTHTRSKLGIKTANIAGLVGFDKDKVGSINLAVNPLKPHLCAAICILSFDIPFPLETVNLKCTLYTSIYIL